MMLQKSFLKSSGQLWKLWLSLALVVLGWLSIPLALGGYVDQDSGALLILAGVFVAVCATVWASISIKCPACKARLLWRAISKESHKTWLVSLLSQSECPHCGAAFGR